MIILNIKGKVKMVKGLEQEEAQISRTGMWDKFYRADQRPLIYGAFDTVYKGIAYINDPNVETVEDWGCGYGGLKFMLPSRMKYTGLDGSHSKYADKIVDLEKYRSTVDSVFMRHIIEHNPNWSVVLENALQSFTKKMVLILFTPFQEETKIIQRYPNWLDTGITMFDIGFKRSDIIDAFGSIKWTSEENLVTETGYSIEHVFYLSK